MMTEQLRFERWATANGYAVHRRGDCQDYAHQITRLLWQAWQAARDQHIGNVQLPAECVEQHLDSMRDAIDAAMRIQAAEAV